MDYCKTPTPCTKFHCEEYFEIGLGFIDDIESDKITIEEIMVILNARKHGDSSCFNFKKQYRPVQSTLLPRSRKFLDVCPKVTCER